MSMTLFASVTRPGLPGPTALRFPETRHLFHSVTAFAASFSPSKSSVGSSQCNATTPPAEYKEYTGNDLAKTTVDGIEKDIHSNKGLSDKTRELVMSIRSILRTMEEGEISMSPYDTAWVAMVEDIDGGGGPHFPSTLDWISSNQLADGSWGDPIFLVYDRLINTFACVIALTSWKMHPDKCDKAISFIRENMYKLDDEKEERMPIGFEMTFPPLVEKAKRLNINFPDDSPGLRKIYAQRDLKFKRIPWDKMHTVPTTLLYSLEGMALEADVLDWQKLLKLQSPDGSLFYSPASTAFALQQTGDHNCLQYLLKLVQTFNGGVPNLYPLDLYERSWAVDRLQRLGISRFFEPQIEECMKYVHRYWSNKNGVYAARHSDIQDIDDTSMGFRVLRLNGFDVSPDAFKQFEDDDGEFLCFIGQTNHSVSATYNLYRASQVMFPGEEILQRAKKFSTKFLQDKRAENELLDKWVITKDLPGEVGYALDVPWYASLPRVEARFYIEQYGGEDVAWIGKVLFRAPNVNNDNYLELAKLDYNDCQALHQHEWKNIQQWYKSCGLRGFGLGEESLLLAYYIAAASVFEPEKSGERLAWAKTAALVKTITSQKLTKDQKHDFIREFEQGSILENANGGRCGTSNKLVETIFTTVHKMSLETSSRDIHHQLLHAWRKWVVAWEVGGDGDAELFVQTLNLTGGSSEPTPFCHPKYQQLLEVTTRICHQLRKSTVKEIQVESDMQELVKLVVTKSSGDLDSDIKQKFLTIARSFYYAAHCSTEAIGFHIVKVLFERLV
uniref:ent-copalyl diphosphate synthase 2, chloroplastic n=1 Tax=Marrubium vulgare TaxID=41230 RepID=CPS2_MARVU|nr:RecName: Full=ent-copalyl diphosphate synthase 2, chloroplastic; Short=MvCPS2; Flags: Precursor [Marrubium vulgare]AIE77091.1 class II diterpene synthase [Marrubium vulgare]